MKATRKQPAHFMEVSSLCLPLLMFHRIEQSGQERQRTWKKRSRNSCIGGNSVLEMNVWVIQPETEVSCMRGVQAGTDFPHLDTEPT